MESIKKLTKKEIKDNFCKINCTTDAQHDCDTECTELTMIYEFCNQSGIMQTFIDRARMAWHHIRLENRFSEKNLEAISHIINLYENAYKEALKQK